MLDEVRCIRRACDLDLLLFFARHPCALLAAEQIFAHLGYDFQQAAVALEALVDAGIVKRSRGRTGAVCFYALEASGLEGAALRSLLRLSATPSGRRNIMRLLKSRLGSGPVASVARRAAPEATPHDRAFA